VDLASALGALTGAEFLYEASLYPEAEYAFKHPLTQEVALHSQLHERRRLTHAAVARAIEELQPEKLDEQAAVLARHWEEAGELLQAAQWHARAAGWAGTSDPAESVRHWQKVRALTESFSETEEASSLQLLAYGQILNLGWRLGLSDDEWEALFAEGKALAERRGDTRAVAFLVGLHANRMALSGNATAAVEHQMEAVRLSDESGDLEMRCLTRLGLAYACFCAGRLPEALKAADRALELTREDLTMGVTTVGFSAFIWLLQFRGIIERWMGRLDQARRDADRALELARESKNPENLGWALGLYVYQAQFSGEVGSERGQALQAVEIAEKLGSPFSLFTALRSLGIAQLLHEDWPEAIHALEQSLEIGRSRSIYQEHDAGILALLAIGYLGAGQVERARKTAEEAIRVARRGGARHYELEAQLHLARVLMASEGAAARPAIEESLARALGLVGETGAKGIEPQIIEARAELANLLGDEPSRERELREAHRLYTEMGATGHAERVARELAKAEFAP
jgi:adenylate cyclase